MKRFAQSRNSYTEKIHTCQSRILPMCGGSITSMGIMKEGHGVPRYFSRVLSHLSRWRLLYSSIHNHNRGLYTVELEKRHSLKRTWYFISKKCTCTISGLNPNLTNWISGAYIQNVGVLWVIISMGVMIPDCGYDPPNLGELTGIHVPNRRKFNPANIKN